MRSGEGMTAWFLGFLIGSVIYLFLTVLTVRRVKDLALKLVLLGLLTVVVAVWYGGLPHPGILGMQGADVSIENVLTTLAVPGAAVLSRVGVILVLAGLAKFLLAPGEKTEPTGNPGTAI